MCRNFDIKKNLYSNRKVSPILHIDSVRYVLGVGDGIGR